MDELILVCLEEDSVEPTLIDEPFHKSDFEGERMTVSVSRDLAQHGDLALHSPRVAASNAFCLGRGRDISRPIPPAEIPTSGTTAGSLRIAIFHLTKIFASAPARVLSWKS